MSKITNDKIAINISNEHTENMPPPLLRFIISEMKEKMDRQSREGIATLGGMKKVNKEQEIEIQELHDLLEEERENAIDLDAPDERCYEWFNDRLAYELGDMDLCSCKCDDFIDHPYSEDLDGLAERICDMDKKIFDLEKGPNSDFGLRCWGVSLTDTISERDSEISELKEKITTMEVENQKRIMKE